MFARFFCFLSVLSLCAGSFLLADAKVETKSNPASQNPASQQENVQKERTDVEEDTETDQDVMIMEEDEDSLQG